MIRSSLLRERPFTLPAWHETTTIYIHTHPLATTHGEPYKKTSRLGQEMEDTRRERKVAQEIIVQHISKHASEALPSITVLVAPPKTARRDSSSVSALVTHLAESYLKITGRVSRLSETRRKPCESDVSSNQGTVKNSGGWWL